MIKCRECPATATGEATDGWVYRQNDAGIEFFCEHCHPWLVLCPECGEAYEDGDLPKLIRFGDTDCCHACGTVEPSWIQVNDLPACGPCFDKHMAEVE